MLESTATKRLPLGGEAVRLVLTDEARNPPLPVADTGGCSANEATSFASVSVAKRLCRIVRAVAAAAALSFNSCDNDHYVVYTSPPPSAEPLLKEKPLGGCIFQLLRSTTPDFRTQQTPRGTLIADQRRACAARPKGKYSRGRMALAPIRTREFSLPRGGAAVPPSSLKPVAFTTTTPVLCYFLH